MTNQPKKLMMKKPVLLLFTLFSGFGFLHSQELTWSEHIAPIMYKNCGSCHHDGGVAPFSLTDYQTAVNWASLIELAVSTDHMPPWPPDPEYRHFAFERTISPDEKFAILEWIATGAHAGDLSQTPPAPEYPEGGMLPGTPDLVLQIPTYTVQAQNQDEYRCFVIPNAVLQDKFVTSWEIVPGNRSIVHHVVVYQDETNQCAALDAATPGPGYSCFGGACSNAKIFGAWAPGGNPLVYPESMGIRLKAGADIVIEMHYPAGSAGQVDSTRIHLFFAPQSTGMREVQFDAVADPWQTIQNGPFIIPANQVKTFNTKLNINFGTDITLLRVLPHMHLLGKSMKSWLVEPGGAQVPLIHIPEWDFHWQGMYAFPQPVRIKNGSQLFTQFTYDNTIMNPDNPNSPPQTVGYGESTTDEMLFLFVEYATYQPGDENIVLDSSFITPVFEAPRHSAGAELFPCQPNPVSDFTLIPFYLAEKQEVSIRIFDATGREIAQPLPHSVLPAGRHSVALRQKLSPGIYFVRLGCENGEQKSSKFVVE
jgi:hypothetical protein